MQSSNPEEKTSIVDHPFAPDETIARYDQTAAEFAARWSDLRLERALTTFTSHLGGRRLVLDLGCGPGRDVEFLAELGCRAIGLDLSAGMLAEARRRLPQADLIRADLRRPPLKSASIDGVWACASLLHLPRADMPAALAEIARLLRRPDGLLYLALKGGQGERWIAGQAGQRTFFAYYQPDEVETLLRYAGFRTLENWIASDQAGRHEPWLNYLAAVESG